MSVHQTMLHYDWSVVKTSVDNFELIDIIYDVLRSFGGGGGDFFQEVNRFMIGTFLYLFLLWFAISRKSSEYYERTREYYLSIGFTLGLCRNFFMLCVSLIIYVTSVSEKTVHGVVIHTKMCTPVVLFLESFFPPIEHALHYASVGVIATAFLVYLTKETITHKYYIKGICISTVLFYCISQYSRFLQINPFYSHEVVRFGTNPTDLIWHIIGFLVLVWPAYCLWKERVTWLTKTILSVFGMYAVYEVGKIIDILTVEQYEVWIAPVRHCLYLAIIPVFLYIYIKENNLRLEEKTNSVRILADQLETFVRGTVHELRSPVAGIEGTLDILEMKYESVDVTDDRNEVLDRTCPRNQFCEEMYSQSEKMHESIMHVSEVLETMSDFGHTSDQSKMDYYSLDILLRKAVRAIKFQDVVKSLPTDTIRLAPIEGVFKCLVSPVKFRQIIDNLVRNAVYAIIEGGTTHPEISIDLTCNRDTCSIYVTDNGIGMDEDAIEHCFDKRYTSKGGKGTGLGLYFSKMYMNEFFGSISVKSHVGLGSIFTLEFPVGSRSKLGKEGRRQNRMSCDIDCIIEQIPVLSLFSKQLGKNEITGKIVDMSDQGVGVVVDSALPIGQKLKIYYGKKPSDGVVKWTSDECGAKVRVGIELSDNR